MKKTFKNSDVLNISNTLQLIGIRKGNVKERWKLALLSEPFLRKSDLIIASQNQLINEYGKTNKETKQKTLNVEEEHYVELMNCETEIDFNEIDLNDLQEAGINELIALKEVILNG